MAGCLGLGKSCQVGLGLARDLISRLYPVEPLGARAILTGWRGGSVNDEFLIHLIHWSTEESLRKFSTHEFGECLVLSVRARNVLDVLYDVHFFILILILLAQSRGFGGRWPRST